LWREASALTDVGRYEAAIPLLTRAAGLDQDTPAIKCDLALALMCVGRDQEADMTAYQAIASAPDDDRPYRIRSIVLRHAGRAGEAVSMAQEAVRLDPANPSSLDTLARAYLAADENDNAWETAVKVVALAPEKYESHELVGRAALALKLWQVAEHACREALRLDPTDWVSMNNLGVALANQDRTVEAVQAYQRAAQMSPDAEAARDNLVEAVQPVSPRRAAIYMVRVGLWKLPFVLFVWFAHWIRSIWLRSKLSSGAADYYRTRTIGGAIRRMSAREFGILCALAALLVLAPLLLFVVIGLAAINPGGAAFNYTLALASWLVLAAAMGLLCGRRRSKAK
jgi:Flp pilus assembly protein TadD